MSGNGFHSEWVTIGKHRILIECRDSFPSNREHFIATVAAEFVSNHSDSARVAKIFYDDKASSHCILIVSTDKSDSEIQEPLSVALANILNCGNTLVDVQVVKRGNESSDHYDHMEYLSRNAGVIGD